MRLSREPRDVGRSKDLIGPCRTPQRKNNDIMSLPASKAVVNICTMSTYFCLNAIRASSEDAVRIRNEILLPFSPHDNEGIRIMVAVKPREDIQTIVLDVL